MPLGLAVAASAADAAIHKKMFESSMTTLIISNEEMGDIMEIVKSLEESVLLKKGVSETIQNVSSKTKRRISQYTFRYTWCQIIRKFIKAD